MTRELWWDRYFILTDSIHMFNNSSIRLSTKFILATQTEEDIQNFRIALLQVIFNTSDLCEFDKEYSHIEVLDTLTEKYDMNFGATLNFFTHDSLEESSIKAITSEITAISRVVATLTYMELDNRIDLGQLIGTHTLQEKIINHLNGVHEGSKIGKIVRTVIQNQFTEMPRQRVRYYSGIMTDNINVNMIIALYNGVDYNVLNSITSIESIQGVYNAKSDKDVEFLADYFTTLKTDNPVKLNQVILEIRNSVLSMVVQESNMLTEHLVYLNTPIDNVLRKVGVSQNTLKYVKGKSRKVKDFLTSDFLDATQQVSDELKSVSEYIDKNIAPKER